MRDPEFAGWFAKLKGDVEMLATEPETDTARLVLVHSKLIGIIDFFDPHNVVVPPKYRTRIELR